MWKRLAIVHRQFPQHKTVMEYDHCDDWCSLELPESHWWQSFWVFWSACFTVNRSKFCKKWDGSNGKINMQAVPLLKVGGRLWTHQGDKFRHLCFQRSLSWRRALRTTNSLSVSSRLWHLTDTATVTRHAYNVMFYGHARVGSSHGSVAS